MVNAHGESSSKTKRTLSQRRVLLSALAGLLIATVALGAAYAALSKDHFYVRIDGRSMTPTFQDGDHVVFKKTDPYQRNAVALFRLPKSWEAEWTGTPGASVIKRITLVPGDRLAFDGQTWYGNGKPFSSIIAAECTAQPTAEDIIVPEGSVFVTGDSTEKTFDSRAAFCRGLPYFVEGKDILNVGVPVKIL